MALGRRTPTIGVSRFNARADGRQAGFLVLGPLGLDGRRGLPPSRSLLEGRTNNISTKPLRGRSLNIWLWPSSRIPIGLWTTQGATATRSLPTHWVGARLRSEGWGAENCRRDRMRRIWVLESLLAASLPARCCHRADFSPFQIFLKCQFKEDRLAVSQLWLIGCDSTPIFLK